MLPHLILYVHRPVFCDLKIHIPLLSFSSIVPDTLDSLPPKKTIDFLLPKIVIERL